MSQDTELVINEITQDAKNMARLCWVGTLFFGFIPALVLLFVKQDDDYIQAQSKEALNWFLTGVVGYSIGFMLFFSLMGVMLTLVLAISHLVFCTIGALATSKGDSFRVPLACD
ncbi:MULTISPECIES: DUF4870 domain-containing protein [unclassified Shewanella]|uniref:DUF4870 domain-containing protein n=1 Tax=unclassified Shewanella TaxID=196818 RepID=UPI000C85137D|nr:MULTISPECIES: DUF4870 domain-containing protein [unclassified Shewanella]MDO6620936.1 DUF4870 domain-containing protein [Shewanella sp. 6_MG-2023]MDO6678051.1 DUF4870 domain-containing protein [Shewanella sp. 4_MG-2023]PMG49585.1 hypothetical protein BCU91_02630 [Shewanella sp. 10N.286.52.B9]